ncbi:unnamed protein product [Darwinula stevensoni]|uniref:Uncharacterized protein n=1 Tax=Darwinula stevensoni TaxID=69355 RepID=A0A7R9FSB5_9CRUS|nr:unnamed protein product [Darwinula stevensoni]CAG0902281.1 unnamed protein product [Darwinula stevensoni]
MLMHTTTFVGSVRRTSIQMRDRRGVDRGHWKECGESECVEYELPPDESKNECFYCSCPPVKHERKQTAQNFGSNGIYSQDIPWDGKTVESNPLGNTWDEKGKTFDIFMALPDPVLSMEYTPEAEVSLTDDIDTSQEDSLSCRTASMDVPTSALSICSVGISKDSDESERIMTNHQIIDRLAIRVLHKSKCIRGFNFVVIIHPDEQSAYSVTLFWEFRNPYFFHTLSPLKGEVINFHALNFGKYG